MSVAATQASLGYGAARGALKPDSQAGGDALKTEPNEGFEAVHRITASVAKAEDVAMKHMTTGADPHSVVEAIAAAQFAIETAAVVRDKVVEAYQELIRMPI